MSEHDPDPHAMVGAHVADALDDQERTAFEQHLARCESCPREVAEFAETLGELSWVAEAPPPPPLRAAVLAEIATVRPLPPDQPEQPAAAESPSADLWSAELGSAAAGATADRWTGPGDGVGSAADELARRRQRRTRRLFTGLVAAAMVVVLALGGWVAVLHRQQSQQLAANQQVGELLTAPDATVHTTTLNGSAVSYVVSHQRNQVLFVGTDVPPPGAGKTYQLWTLHGTDATAQGLMAGGSDAHWFTGPLGQADSLAVTVEPAGGSSSPTTTALAVVKL